MHSTVRPEQGHEVENSGVDAGTHLGIPVPTPKPLDGGSMGWRVCKNSLGVQRTLLGAEAKGQSGLAAHGNQRSDEMLVSMTSSAQPSTLDAELNSPLPPGTLAPPPTLPP